MPDPEILVVDDEESIRNLVTSYLRAEGYEYATAIDGPSALETAQAFKPDLIVLDIMLPGMNGLEVLSQLRRKSDVYVIMLTAKTEETDKVIGLSVGADDYLTKPFSPRELMARINAALRRIRKNIGSKPASYIAEKEHLIHQLESYIATGQLKIDPSSRQVWVADKLVELTTTEFDLLLTLAEHRGMVLSREQLLEKVWGHDYFGEIRVVDVHLGHIRQKLGDHHNITTVRGVGYRFEKERV